MPVPAKKMATRGQNLIGCEFGLVLALRDHKPGERDRAMGLDNGLTKVGKMDCFGM